jgi:ubiquinone/menaquinone biosynthesis C-methylase UbiE
MKNGAVANQWPLPREDYWSTPFAEALLDQLDLHPGLSILDIACGDGVPAFYLAEQVGPTGRVLGVDLSLHQIARAQARQGRHLPWLRFERGDMRALPFSVPVFDRITGNLSVMFFRPNRFETVQELLLHLKPGGQVALSFPSLGTFDSLWQRIGREMAERQLTVERQRLALYVAERPSASDGRQWLETLGLERIVVSERPLEVASGPGRQFLNHPLLRGGFLDDAYECFDDSRTADQVMNAVADDLSSFAPLIAQRCVMSGWKKEQS